MDIEGRQGGTHRREGSSHNPHPVSVPNSLAEIPDMVELNIWLFLNFSH